MELNTPRLNKFIETIKDRTLSDFPIGSYIEFRGEGRYEVLGHHPETDSITFRTPGYKPDTCTVSIHDTIWRLWPVK